MKKIGGFSIMKKALSIGLLLSGFFLYGCGSRAGTTASSDGNDTTSIPGGSQSTTANGFTLNLVDFDAAKTAHYTNPGTPPEATDVRVVIRRYDTATIIQTICDSDSNGEPILDTCTDTPVTQFMEVFKDIQDVSYSGSGSITIGIPAGLGYTLDVITSELTGTTQSILKYGQATGIDIVSGATVTITMKTVSQLLSMTVADDVVSKGKFDVTLNNILPFVPGYKMTMSFGGQAPVEISTTANKCTFTAPESFTAGTVSLQGKFTIDRSFLSQNESAAKWTRLFPNAAYGEAVYSNLSPLIAITIPL